ncbi:uncharacterized protein BDZ99DRAFT_42881 [Mytilinidion resinicola]|uniref:Microbial-type PARG catalytic domain-containing protein n=1 Tax=Mytilinidion resinicola TaxID=574789 RepID=A0A6A6YM66_9PEZI|nr:uncharacterized protein BDZ99DRAFT_42881 [Mytilinidion resinicola]KAF2808957.1 hypothetical protein BDZ99DRAFT_42881 [Mytilinidion resinicola]
MGRAEPSAGIAPQAHRKNVRAKLAKAIINKTIPAITSKNARAAKGVNESTLVIDPPAAGQRDGSGRTKDTRAGDFEDLKGKGKSKIKAKSKSKRKGNEVDFEEKVQDHEIPKVVKSSKDKIEPQPRGKIRIRILPTDTLTAALHISAPTKPKDHFPHSNVTILNMASPLRPGGGILTGATSQEEFLCARTTLLPSLHERFYRLPTIGGILSRDVLVFRGAGALDTPELPVKERWWVDVVSAGMLRFPDVAEEEVDGEMVKQYLSTKDRETAKKMIRAVMRMCVMTGRKKVVLGAWGCGAYGNPVMEVARAWREVLLGEGESWEPVEEVVFGILDRKMAGEFAVWFGKGVDVEDEEVPRVKKKLDQVDREDEVDEEEDREELRIKIKEMEDRIERVKVPQLRATLEGVLDGMKKQLADREGGHPSEHSETVSSDGDSSQEALDLEDDEEELDGESDEDE